jgi:hypothetical protein
MACARSNASQHWPATRSDDMARRGLRAGRVPGTGRESLRRRCGMRSVRGNALLRALFRHAQSAASYRTAVPVALLRSGHGRLCLPPRPRRCAFGPHQRNTTSPAPGWTVLHHRAQSLQSGDLHDREALSRRRRCRASIAEHRERVDARVRTSSRRFGVFSLSARNMVPQALGG